MALSTTNFLGVVNEVMLNVGERVVNDFTTPTARKAKQFVIEALRELQLRDDWEFLRDFVNAASWASPGIATLPSYQRLHAVQYLVPNTGSAAINKVFLSYLDRPSFERITPFAFLNTDVNMLPDSYTMLDDARIQVKPYPNDTLTQARVSFHITRAMTMPNLTTDFLPIPERLIPLVVRLASSIMAARHLDDINMSQLLRNEFEAMLRQIRAREQLTPSTGTNMFRRRVYR